MTTVDVTPEEIEGAPLLINPKVKEVNPTTRSRLNLALCIVLAVDTLFQLIAIVTPGWNVQRTELGSSHESVYYTIVCADITPLENVSTTVCHSRTFLDDFSKIYNAAKDSMKPELAGTYNLRVRYQINIQISWFIVAGATVFQIIRYIRANEAFSRLTAINAMLLICACSAMYQALYEALVTLDVTSRQAEYLNVKVGFPYSVLLYAVTCMQTCVCSVVVVKQLYDYIRHLHLALEETKVQVNTLQMQYETEAEEFRHYRHLHSEKNRLGSRNRKSHHVDRNSKRDKHQHKQHSKVNSSEVDHCAKNIELLDISSISTHTGLPGNNLDKYDVCNIQDLSRRTSDLSDVSRDSSIPSRNHHHSRYESHRKSAQQTNQSQISKAGTKLDNDHASMRNGHSSEKQNDNENAIEAIIDTDSVTDNINMISKQQSEEKYINYVLKNKENDDTKYKNTTDLDKYCENPNAYKHLHSNTTRTVSAEVHIPSIDGDVIED